MDREITERSSNTADHVEALLRRPITDPRSAEPTLTPGPELDLPTLTFSRPVEGPKWEMGSGKTVSFKFRGNDSESNAGPVELRLYTAAI